VARSEDGGTYPVGSLLQLVPGEAMVKRAEGFSPGTKDWEFFELDVSAEGTSIRVRGGVEAVNRFGGSCADCHAKAEPQYDFVCELDHGCDPLGLNRDVIRDIQESDPRPRATS
jgi:mono/diheme cytochrome c family protein